MMRFHRTELLLGGESLRKLQEASVTIVGLGAVGSFAAEGLARAGIGHLRLVDFDEIRETNINRQLYALNSTLGRPKADVARERILDIHPGIQVDIFKIFVDDSTVHDILRPPTDVLIDAIDSAGPKASLLAAAHRQRIPCILSSMGAATRVNPLDIRAGDLFATKGCPLARLMRKRLRRQGITEGIRCVYSLEPPRPHAVSLEPTAFEPPVLERGRPRRPLGSLACITGVFGLVAAREAIFAIIGSSGDPSS